MAGRSSGEHTALHRENAARAKPRVVVACLAVRISHVNNCFTVKQLFLLIAQERRPRDGLCSGLLPPPMASQARLASHSALPEFTFAIADTT